MTAGFKSVRVWWRWIAGLLAIGAALERATTTGHVLTGPGPTILYAVCGLMFIVDGFRWGRKENGR